MLLLAWLLAGAIAVVITGWSIFNKSQEITVSEAGGLFLLWLSGFLGLAMVAIMSVIFFFEAYGDKPFFKGLPEPKPKPVTTNKRVKRKVKTKLVKEAKCGHIDPCYRPECK